MGMQLGLPRGRQGVLLEGRGAKVGLRYGLLVRLLSLLHTLVLLYILLLLQERNGSILFNQTNQNNIWTWYLLSV